MTDCATVLAALARGDVLDAAGEQHRATCAGCAAAAPGLAGVARRIAAAPPPAPPPDLDAAVLRAAAPLLAENARAAGASELASPVAPTLAQRVHGRAAALDGRRLAAALVPAILLFPLLVAADVWLLRAVHGALATVLPYGLTTYLVLSYAALLAALVCLTFGAIPLLVERQAAPLAWKEEHA